MPFPHLTEDPKLLKKVLIHASGYIIININGKEETGKSQMRRGQDITDIFYNQTELWLFETDMAVVMQWSVTSFQCHLHCKTKDFPTRKVKTKK